MTARNGTNDPILIGSVSNAKIPQAVKIGFRSSATVTPSVVIGAFARAATGTQTISIGGSTNSVAAAFASGQGAIAIGASAAVLGVNTPGARASGANSIAIGGGSASTSGANAQGSGTICIGFGSQGPGQQAIAIGQSSNGNVFFGIAIGNSATAQTGNHAIAIGSGTNVVAAPTASATGTIAIGASDASGVNGAIASAVSAIAIGSGDSTNASAAATAVDGIAIGRTSIASQIQAIAIGSFSASTTATNTISIGAGVDATRAASATGLGAIAIGSTDASAVNGPRASGAQSIAIGGGTTAQAGASATAAQSIAIGRTAVAANANAVALGDGVTTTNTSQVNIGTKRLFAGAPTTAPADADLANSQISFYLTEANDALGIKVKESGGTVNSNDIFIGAWVAWTPTLTNLTIGNGTSVAAFTRIGRAIHWRWAFTLGTTSAVATDPSFTLPVSPNAAYTSDFDMGRSTLVDTGVNVYDSQITFVSGSTVRLWAMNSAGTFIVRNSITSTVPFTWGNTDQILAQGTYEAAT